MFEVLAQEFTKYYWNKHKNNKKECRPIVAICWDGDYLLCFCCSTSENKNSISFGKGFIQVDWLVYLHQDDVNEEIEQVDLDSSMRDLLIEKFSHLKVSEISVSYLKDGKLFYVKGSEFNYAINLARKEVF